MRIRQRIDAWIAKNLHGGLLQTKGSCVLCGFEGWEDDVREHVVLSHYAEYRYARKHGALPYNNSLKPTLVGDNDANDGVRGAAQLASVGRSPRLKGGIMASRRNTAWVIVASAPLLRPGLSISITVSERYVLEEAAKLLEKVREINLAAQQAHEADAAEGRK